MPQTTRHSVYLISLMFLLGCQSKQESQQTVQSDQTPKPVQVESAIPYVPFPTGYGYMQDIPVLQKATDEGNSQVIREHAWGLWAGIMQPVNGLGWPIWYTWPNTYGAFAVTEAQLEAEPHAVATGKSLRHVNRVNSQSAHAPPVDTPAPVYPVPPYVKSKFPGGICQGGSGEVTVCDGPHFVNNGDILIATESLSMAAMKDIRSRELYLKATLDAAHKAGKHMIEVTDEFIVTKHMYWPVKANGVTMVPVWKDNYPDSYTGYAGYEFWNTMVALNPSDPASVGQTVEGQFLYEVMDHSGRQPLPTVKGTGVVHDISDFYHHQVTQSDWDSFNDADKAIITAASLWANNQPFEVGDYLVTVAMHVNTKELASWTLQSVWWSDTPDEGIYAANRPQLPQAVGPWDHYLLTDAYAVPAVNGLLQKAVNPYIEGVIHPIATNCRNCHVRAGWPQIMASYQNADCPDLLQDLTPDSPCLKGITLSDYLWIIPDRAK